MIIVSHGSENLRLLCDRVIWLDHGEIRAVGPASEIVDQYERSTGGRTEPEIKAAEAPLKTPIKLPLTPPLEAPTISKDTRGAQSL
jgi:ABC-type multidrug transport system ATPase subunit